MNRAGLKRVEKGCFNPSISGEVGLKRVESPLGLNPSTLPDGPNWPEGLFELATTLRETFGPLLLSGPAVHRAPPEWTRWPSHTAADMGPPWIPPGKRLTR